MILTDNCINYKINLKCNYLLLYLLRILENYLFNFKLSIVVFLCFTLMIIPGYTAYGERLLEQYGDKVIVSAEITKLKIKYKVQE